MADQPDFSGSAMIALYPPPDLAGRLTVPGGLEPDDMHVTVAYAGDAADVDPNALKASAAALAARHPIAGVISGHARFTGDQDVIVALADSPGLERLRADALRVLGARGIAVPAEHGYTPHCTIQYLGQDDPDPIGRLAAEPVTFGSISAVHGNVRTDYPLISPVTAESAAEAFAAGWALSGGPMTDRVTRGCSAAVSLAAEHAGEPGILEATLRLGHLTGVWATVYTRQDHLYAIAAEAVAVAWRKLLRGLEIAAVVSAIRREAAMTGDGSPAPGTDSQSATAAKYHKRAVRDIAAMLLAGLLAGLPSLIAWPAFLKAITAGLTAAAAEGYASALAVAASKAGHAGFDWDAAVSDAQKQEPEPGTAEIIASAVVAGAVTDMAVTLAGMAAAGATAAAMTAAVRAYLQDPAALTAYLQQGMGSAGAAATLAVFDQAQVERVLFITAGDDRVCPVCDGLEAANPYTADTFPKLPVHVRCRCNAHSEGGDAALFDMYADYISQRRAA